ncbi:MULTISPECIES: DNA-binding protein [Streptomyces albidoflavus group]|uniref:DNA-binding protein n=1 Tax=Streptomyces albidoflavus TaxID=1886 RepID=A0ABY3GV91_9ACTN|nr:MULTISPECIES: DNA-binding protein [Streptomyces albidoflavus group]TWV20185.1 DNA-binding protein [Streptomyces albidoflavus]
MTTEPGAQQPSPDANADAPFTAPDPEQARTHRVHASLFRIAERHAATDEQRRRQVHPSMIGPHEAVRLVSYLLSGTALPEGDEPEVDQADVTAALTLVPSARADLDELETGLIRMARGRGMTWQEIAFGLGLGTPQAARQRYERLAGRAGGEGGRGGGVAGAGADGGERTAQDSP